MRVRKGLITLTIVGGICLAAGCTPKPSAEQLTQLEQACEAADQAEAAAAEKRREKSGVQQQVTRKNRRSQAMESKTEKTR
ncbi:MAG: hypothetical protein QGH20_08025, partial [Candidatus Latescibacteria bacterium]|nr:hypothetical protein [Candidatus Latescibacterota bacterium]